MTGVLRLDLCMLFFLIGHTIFLKKYLWKIKVPLKNRIFMWFVYKKVLLTKDNLCKEALEWVYKMCFLWFTENN
jgi:hypothetical protein